MSSGRQLSDFQGVWALEREISDLKAGQSGTFSGVARLSPVECGLLYEESGTLALKNSATMEAKRSFHWKGQGSDIQVLFEDGRPFHRIECAAPICRDMHFCDPDIYRVVYDFRDWPKWEVEWDVQGPRKTYLMRSVYTFANSLAENSASSVMT